VFQCFDSHANVLIGIVASILIVADIIRVVDIMTIIIALIVLIFVDLLLSVLMFCKNGFRNGIQGSRVKIFASVGQGMVQCFTVLMLMEQIAYPLLLL